MPDNIERLSDSEVRTAIERLPGWDLVDGKLFRKFDFADFVEAVGFMMRSAIEAERLNHHPDWSNLYNTVRVALETHDVDGISRLDLELAAKMNDLAS